MLGQTTALMNGLVDDSSFALALGLDFAVASLLVLSRAWDCAPAEHAVLCDLYAGFAAAAAAVAADGPVHCEKARESAAGVEDAVLPLQAAAAAAAADPVQPADALA